MPGLNKLLAASLLIIYSVLPTGVLAATVSPDDVHSVNYTSEFYDANNACAPGADLTVSGKASGGIGKGLPQSTAELLQKIFVAAGSKFNVAPNLVAALYYVENFQGGDSGSSTVSNSPGTVKGDGNWRDPAPPYGKGPAWPVSSAGATGPFQFLPGTWSGEKQDGNGDGSQDIKDLWDSAFGAANYIAHNGGKKTDSTSRWRNAIKVYNHADWYADDVLATYKFLSSSDQSTVDSNDSSCSNGAGGIGKAVDGFVFPVITTQKALRDSAKNGLTPIPCTAPQAGGCHHDYYAADIGPGEGSTVVAAVAGTVRQLHDVACTGSTNAPRIHIEGEDGRWYFYQHLRPGSIKVRVGQKVAAGDKLGTVGPNACAENTHSHLHFDMTNTNAPNSYFGRPGPNALKYLVNPMPSLNDAYNNLPKE